MLIHFYKSTGSLYVGVIHVCYFTFTWYVDSILHHKITLRFFKVMVPSYSAGENVSIMADKLSSDTEYLFTCYARSLAGRGNDSDQITVRTGKLSFLYNILVYVHIVI